MSLVEKVAALRTFFGLLPSLELLPAVTSMNTLMGIVGEGPLPQQVDSLIAATGVTITTPGRAPAAAPAAAAAAAAAPVDAAVGKKRAAPESAPPLKHQRARTMEHMFPQAEKTEIRAEELRKQRVAAAAGMDYKPRDSLLRGGRRGGADESAPGRVRRRGRVRLGAAGGGGGVRVDSLSRFLGGLTGLWGGVGTVS
jgi:hypothetical protein